MKVAATSRILADSRICLNKEMAFELLSYAIRKKLSALKAPKWWKVSGKAVGSVDDLLFYLSREKLRDHRHLDWVREYLLPIMLLDACVWLEMKTTFEFFKRMKHPPQYYCNVRGPRTVKRLDTIEHKKRDDYYELLVKSTAYAFTKLLLQREVQVLEVDGVPKEDLVIVQFPKEIDFITNMFDLADNKTMCITRRLKEISERDQTRSKDEENTKKPVDVLKKQLESKKETRKLVSSTKEQTRIFSKEKLVTVKMGPESNQFLFGAESDCSFHGSRKERLTAGLKKVISDVLCRYFNQTVSEVTPYELQWSLFFLSTKKEGDQVPHTDCDPNVIWGKGGTRSEMHYLVDVPLTTDGMSLNVWPKNAGVLSENPVIVNIEAGQMIVRSPKLVHGGAFKGPRKGTEALRVHMEIAMNKKQEGQLTSSMIYSSDEKGKRYASRCNRRDGTSFLQKI